MLSRIYRLRAITPLHIGVGLGEGEIDLPIAREKSTGLPMAPGSAVKGVLRDAMAPAESDPREADWEPVWINLFGPKYSETVNQQGMLSFDDARLLAMPVRSLKGNCAWVTCPFVLGRYMEALSGTTLGLPASQVDQIVATNVLLHQNVAILEEFDLTANGDVLQCRLRDEWATHLADVFLPLREAGSAAYGAGENFRDRFRERVAIVSDEVFAFFADFATDSRARIRLSENRVVEPRALWYEENLPAGSLLFGEWGAQRVRKVKDLDPVRACEYVQSQVLQLGGKATVGRGWIDFLV